MPREQTLAFGTSNDDDADEGGSFPPIADIGGVFQNSAMKGKLLVGALVVAGVGLGWWPGAI